MATTSTPPIPREVFEQTQAALLRHDVELYLEYFADEATIETKFTANGQPYKLEGKEAISKALLANKDVPLRRKAFENTIVHETNNPEIIVTEYDMIAESKQDGSMHTISDVLIFRIREGKILSVRTYSNPIAIARAMGTSVDLGKSLIG